MFNNVQLIGNTGQTPDTRLLDNGTKVANFSLATWQRYKSKDGKANKKTTWHKITAFGPIAEIVEKYLTKGSKVFIRGRLNNRSYTDKQGVEKYITEIVCEQIEMLDGKRNAEQQPDQYENNDDLPWEA